MLDSRDLEIVTSSAGGTHDRLISFLCTKTVVDKIELFEELEKVFRYWALRYPAIWSISERSLSFEGRKCPARRRHPLRVLNRRFFAGSDALFGVIPGSSIQISCVCAERGF